MQPGNNKNINRYRVWEPTLLALAIVIGMLAGSHFLSGKKENPIILKQQNFTLDDAESIADVIRYIDVKYVDEVHSDRLIEKAIKSILSELDPHSSYISPAELKEHDEKMRGNFEGIGVEFHMIEDTMAILSVTDDGPAFRAGVEKGDKIVTVNDSLVAGVEIDSDDLVYMLKGEKGTFVRLGIARGRVDSLLQLKITRGEIPIPSVLASFMLNETTGYIKLARFSAKTYEEFMDALEYLVQDKKMQHLVLDLRDNPGGYLNEAVNILSQLFKDKGRLLVYTEGLHAKRMEYNSTGKPFFNVSNIAVLINGGSASASEIVAGAIQDHDRGIIIGKKSFGKGLVQEHYPLHNGGALRLTIARYYTPSGRLIQTPYVIRDGADTIPEKNLLARDTSTYYTLNGREVMSEGGIAPDISADGSLMWSDPVVNTLYGPLQEFVFRQIEAGNMPEAKDVTGLTKKFPGETTLAADVRSYFTGTLDNELLEVIDRHKDEIRRIVLGMTASFQFGKQAWYEVMYEEDPVIKTALSVIEEDRKVTLKF